MNTFSEVEQKILQAATEVFLKKGKDGARMQEIADRAAINKAMLHYYFRSKNRLYEKVFETELEKFFNNLFDSMRDIHEIELFFEKFIDRYLEELAGNPEIIRFILWEIERRGQNFAKVLQQTLSKRGFSNIPLLLKIQQAIQNGQLRAVDPLHLFLSLIGMCVFPFIASPFLKQIFPGVDITSGKFIEQRKEEVFKVLWEGVKRQ